MKTVHILLLPVLLITSFISLPINAGVKKDSQEPQKEQIIKITNNNEIISKKQLERIDPKTIKSIDVHPDTVFITLIEKAPSKKQKKSTSKTCK